MTQTNNAQSIEANSLVKRFPNGFTAVDDLSFEVQRGESVAFLGPNGAGKSTTIKMLCGILAPTSGSAQIAGFRAGTVDASRRLGLVFGTRSQLFMHMTVSQCLDLVGEIYYLTGAAKRMRVSELTELFEIRDLLNQRVRTLSLGQRMRCEVVAALLHRPAVLLADEPTIGLDVIAKNRLRELIQRWLVEEKSTLLLTSHDLSDVEALCSRCVLIDHGLKRFDGPLANLKGDFSDLRRIHVTVQDTQAPSLTGEPRIADAGVKDFIHRYELRTGKIPMSEALARLSAHYGDKLQDIQISEVTLEEVLAQRYRGHA